MKRSLSPRGVTAALLALACGHASAGSIDAPTPPAFLSPGSVAQRGIQCESVGDDVLASQTGKFAGSDMISGFVLSVLTQWHLPNGATAIAQGALTVAHDFTNQLTAQIETEARVTDTRRGTNLHNSGADPAAVATGGQNVAVNGVSQITQVAGNNNVGTNSAIVAYSNSTPQPGIPAAGVPAASNQTAAFAANTNGSIQAGITFANNSINVTVQTPAGIATQNIVPGNAQQASAVAQLLQIAGNSQQVANQLSLALQTQQMGGATIRQTGVLQALRNLH
ncbi:MAG: peptidase C39 [Paraburkholderia sp.]|uniref:peptidase C39 n=1 Tax=Paraburkholderia sp. TaxID=1926495 RepID=UPI0011F43053|nr:peptidase C39 [Paraburkholderia sp.]TAL99450.1 MAG: peptidase C39 [Paraburkholderia sp.]TAM27960.1 MAG: peptidase C39 [Paraburkholderia sp.]